MQVEEYRSRLEEFEETLNRELYRYYAGFKEKLEIARIYRDFGDILSVANIREIERELAAEEVSSPSRRRSLEKIRSFLIDQQFDIGSATLNQAIESVEARQVLCWEGHSISLRQIAGRLRTEPDAAKRRSLSSLYAQACGESEALRREWVIQLHSTAVSLGFKDYVGARERIVGFELESLSSAFDACLERLEDGYLERLEASFRSTLGLSLEEAGRWDLPHWEFKSDPGGVFTGDYLLPSLDTTISELNIRPERPEAVSVDLDRELSGCCGSFCIPIKTPYEIKVAVTLRGGVRDYAALFHECGHACHFAWTGTSLPFEHVAFGDRALTESYAFLLEHLLLEEEWLSRRFSFSRWKEFLGLRSLLRLFLVRQQVGKLRAALSLHQRPFDHTAQIYSDTMRKYTGLPHEGESYLYCLCDGFSSADYLRGWVFEAMLKEHLRVKYGRAWFLSRSAGRFLKDLWETGQFYRVDELCREIGIGDFEPQVLADQLSEGLRI